MYRSYIEYIHIEYIHICTVYTCGVHTAYCVWSVVSSVSNLNRWSSSLGLFHHVPLKRDQGDWDWRLRLHDTPNAIGYMYRVYTNRVYTNRLYTNRV